MHEELLCILLSAGGEFRVTAPYYWLKHLRSDAILFLRNKPSFTSQILPLHTSCVVSVSDRVIARRLDPENTKLEEGGGGGVSFLPFLFFKLFSSRYNFLDELAQKRTQANPILALVQATDVTYNKARDVAHVIPFILNICRGSIVYTYLTITRPK